MHETTVYEAFAAVTRLVYRWDLVLIWVLLRSLQVRSMQAFHLLLDPDFLFVFSPR